MTDAADRDAIRTRLDVTMLVEAAAGTGKTTSLVSRMVNLVETGRASASTIAAITFTLKAAAQLREKFQEALEVGLLPAAGGEKVAGGRMRGALDDIDPGFIGTTHAFCARLLRERPVEAGLDPEFRELDEPAARQIMSAFWHRWYDEQSFLGNVTLAEARDIGLDRSTLRMAFTRVIEYPDVTLVAQRSERPEFGVVIEKLMRLLDEIEPNLPDDTNRDKPDEFEKVVRKLLRLRSSRDLDDPFEQFVLLDEANHASRKPTQKNWPDKATAKALGLQYAAFVTNELRPAVQRWQEYAHWLAIEVLRPAAAAFAEERRRNGTLTFQDLLVCARDLLRDHATVRRYFQKRFTHVLVDEFQDTDPLQAEVLFFLTGEDVEEKSWRKLRPRPGSLFIVGDPKQSIYRFRRADITTYLDVRDLIEKVGEVRKLSTNFRSAPPICTFVNEAFEQLFPEAEVEARRQAPHVPLTPHTPSSPNRQAELFPSSPSPAKAGEGGRRPGEGVYSLETSAGKNDEMARAEAERVAQWILRSVGSELRFSDILLISFQRPRLTFYARVFERLGIPYEITGSKAFAKIDELAKAMPLLCAIVDPEDQVSIVAFLRGPLNGADDDALYRFVRAGGRFSPFAEVPEGTDERIAAGLRTIREGIDDARQHPPAAAIARLFDRLGLLPLSASGERPGTRSGNLLLALSIARDASARGESLAAIVDQLDELIESKPDIEELDVDPARTDAVRLMNLHQVKGLEAPVVFLIDPADERDFDIDLFVDRSGEESRGHFVVARKWGEGTKVLAQPAGWDGYLATEEQFKDAEKRRLLYVAATRAKRMLVIGYRNTARGVKGAWRDLASRVRNALPLPPEVASSPAPAPPAARLFAEAKMEIESRLAAAKESSYSVLPITKIAHANHAELVRAEEGLGKGMSWGRVLHRLFEAMLRDESLDVRLYAENLLKDEERDVVELPEVLRVVTAVQSSALWKRVQASPERYVEIPFALTADAASLGVPGPASTLLHGTIDLVFREGDAWYVVDYKTDSTVGRLDALTEYYTPQVRLYADFWGRLVGGRAVGGVFFVDNTIERWVA